VTAVSATQVKANASVTHPEVAAESIIYSGGGFSNVFDMPTYQIDAAQNYFGNHKPPYGSDRHNITRKSRGFRDVSANGVNYAMAVNSKFIYLYGTSAATPTFGAVISLVNSARLDVGLNPVGFINPALYANPSMPNDITSRGNPGCGTDGFSAVDGWDPVTGLGAPNYPKMLDYFLNLP
jgi:tripeptidyl-peptidase-1